MNVVFIVLLCEVVLLSGAVAFTVFSISELRDAIQMLRQRNAALRQDISDLYENYFKLARDVRGTQTDLINIRYGTGDKLIVKAQLHSPTCTWCGSTQGLTNACSKHSYYVCPKHADLLGNCLSCGMEDIFHA